MTTFPKSPKLLKGGILLIEKYTSVVQRIIALQSKPGMLTTSTFPVQGAGGGTKLIKYKKKEV